MDTNAAGIIMMEKDLGLCWTDGASYAIEGVKGND